MKVYLCDSAERRAWASMMPLDWCYAAWHVPLKPNRASAFVERDSNTPLVAPAVVVVHPEPSPDVLRCMVAQANAENLVVITVSGGDRYGFPQPLSDRAYRRQGAVGKADPGFKRCFARFLAAFESDGFPLFDLLEPDPWPEHLVALHMVLCTAFVAPETTWKLWQALPESIRLPFVERAHEGWLELHDCDQAWLEAGLPRPGAALEAFPARANMVLVAGLLKGLPDADPKQIVLTGTASQEATWRGQLRHSWIKNHLLSRNAGYIARMHEGQASGGETFAKRLGSEGLFAKNIATARALVQAAPKAFSPARLVDGGLLSGFPKEFQEHTAHHIDALYRKATTIEAHCPLLVEAIAQVELDLSDFTKIWFEEPKRQADVVQAGFQRVQQSANHLHVLLGQLPAGVVLP